MNEYKYSAYTSDKKIISGKLKSTSEAAAGQAVLNMGYHRILTLQPIENNAWASKLTFGVKMQVVKDREVAGFSSDLANMLNSGIILVTSLQLLQEQTSNKLLKGIIADIIDTIHNGNSFSAAIQKHDDVFSETYYQVIKASEKSGNLEHGLTYLADHINKQIETKKRIKQIFNYPIIVLTLCFLIGGFLVTSVLPSLIDMFDSMAVELPLITRITMGVSTFLVDNTLTLFLAILIAVLAIILGLRTKEGKARVTRFMLKIPIIKDIILRINLLTYTHMASMLLNTGLQLSNTMYYCAQTVRNPHLHEALMKGRYHLLQGHSVSASLRTTDMFDSLSLEKIAIGERTGDLESAFLKISESYEKAIDESIKAFIAFLEPAVVVGIAIIVGLLALSIITPMYSLVGSF